MQTHILYLGSGVWALFVQGQLLPVCTSGSHAKLEDMQRRLMKEKK